MKKYFFLLLLVPLWSLSQTSTSLKEKTDDGFEITGNITGYEDGTPVSFLNQQTGTPEEKAKIEKGKFLIKGHVSEPSLIVLIFGNQPPAIPIFIDNSIISITGDKNKLDSLKITGSKSQDEFAEYSEEVKPYEKIFLPNADKDSVSVVAVEKISESFVEKNPASYVAPIAIIRVMQASQNVKLADKMFKLMDGKVKRSSFGQYLDQQLAVARVNPIGSEIAEFSQRDTAGKLVKISSFRGKYVLIDFWASWCRPCRMENPNVVKAFDKYHNKNFTILGVSLDQAKPAWLSAIRMDGLTWTQVSDLKGWGNEVASLFHITSIPQNLLIDPTGKIIAKNLRGEALEKKLEELFN